MVYSKAILWICAEGPFCNGKCKRYQATSPGADRDGPGDVSCARQSEPDRRTYGLRGWLCHAAAIDFATIAAISPRADKQAVVYSKNFSEEVERPLDGIGTRGSHHWSDYPLGVLAILQQEGMAVPGFDLTLYGDVPLGAGLSSSASIEVAAMLAMLQDRKS